jgi:molybdopterin-guanine dinucleotide biosynthesis protein B
MNAVSLNGENMKTDDWLKTQAIDKACRMQKCVFGLAGLSNSGKTTLVKELITWFRLEGYTVSSIKHAHQGFDIDRPGKDSFQMREAGAKEVLLIGDQRWVLMREYADESEPTLDEALARLAPCDIVLVEGFKRSKAPKIEVFRPSLGRPPLWPTESSIVAIATDEPLDCALPVLDLNSPKTIAEFIKNYLKL